MSLEPGRDDDLPPGQRADILKERIYITFTALAVVLALRAHAVSAGEAALSLAVVVLGTVLAVLVADVVSHIAVHESLPLRAELRHMARVSFGALGALVLPAVFIASPSRTYGRSRPPSAPPASPWWPPSPRSATSPSAGSGCRRGSGPSCCPPRSSSA
ncbi:hypothetical protein [Jiangella sp. DSM 45060]|uniref:hypothetical protein n=1 Tax=Jiangella sp. DSM 45060 TaxID=1798224 RepID=UPI00087C5040|nr:hypothetical protein [Jiangella sp. DSM 45060]SDS60389.1 hypothetical protein SAMN04515669_1469 [Jiangella sp. DSM 45060]